jgi:branched-chain amino acid transport system substrate-binding protein
MKKSIVFLSVLCFTLAMAGFGSPVLAAEPIKIGGLWGFTSYMAPPAEEISRGYKVAFEQFMPEVAGRPIEVIYEDTASKADLAVQKAKKLIERDKVAILLGPIHGGHAMGVSALTDKYQIPHISAGTNSGGLITSRNWSWITGGALMGISFPTGTYAYKKLGYRTCSVIATDRSVGHEFMEGFYLSWKALGGKVVQEQWAPPGTTQWAPYVAKLNKDVDFLATWIGDADGISGFPAIRQMGVKLPIIQTEFAGAMLSPKAAMQMGKSIIGIITTAWYVHSIDDPKNREFVQAYEKRFKVKPGPFAGAAFGAAQIMVQALKATGGDTDPQKLRKALMQPCDTIAGHVKWTKDRSGIHPIHILQVQEDLTTPKVIDSLVVRGDVVEKEGKRTLAFKVVE